jgi:hypothetical protein
LTPIFLFMELMRIRHFTREPKGIKVYDFEIISIGLANGLHEVATFSVKDFKSVKEISLLEDLLEAKQQVEQSVLTGDIILTEILQGFDSDTVTITNLC